MRHSQRGLGIVQVLLSIVGIVGIASVAAPAYQDYVVRSKMSEAFSIVSDTKNKLTEFYILRNRFPSTERELESVETDMFSPPEFVERVEVKGANSDHDVVIEVYFQPDVIPGDGWNDQFLYVAAVSGSETGAMVEWSCGLRGIDEKYMPSRCLD